MEFVLIALGLLGLFERAIGCDFNRTMDNATIPVSINDNSTNYDELPGQCPSYPAASNFNEQKVFGGKALYKTVYQTITENSTSLTFKAPPSCVRTTYSLMNTGSVWFKLTTKFSIYGDGITATGQFVPVLGAKGQYSVNFTQTPITEDAPDWTITVVSIDEKNNNYVAMVMCANDTEDATHELFVTIKARNGLLSDQELKDVMHDLEKAGLKDVEKQLEKTSIDC